MPESSQCFLFLVNCPPTFLPGFRSVRAVVSKTDRFVYVLDFLATSGSRKILSFGDNALVAQLRACQNSYAQKPLCQRVFLNAYLQVTACSRSAHAPILHAAEIADCVAESAFCELHLPGGDEHRT